MTVEEFYVLKVRTSLPSRWKKGDSKVCYINRSVPIPRHLNRITMFRFDLCEVTLGGGITDYYWKYTECHIEDEDMRSYFQTQIEIK